MHYSDKACDAVLSETIPTYSEKGCIKKEVLEAVREITEPLDVRMKTTEQNVKEWMQKTEQQTSEKWNGFKTEVSTQINTQFDGFKSWFQTQVPAQQHLQNNWMNVYPQQMNYGYAPQPQMYAPLPRQNPGMPYQQYSNQQSTPAPQNAPAPPRNQQGWPPASKMSLKELQCFFCFLFGHYEADCPKKREYLEKELCFVNENQKLCMWDGTRLMPLPFGQRVPTMKRIDDYLAVHPKPTGST